MTRTTSFRSISVAVSMFILVGISTVVNASSKRDDIFYSVEGAYVHDQRSILTDTFVRAVTSGLSMREPKILSRDESKILMQVEYDGLFNIELDVKNENYEISVYPSPNVRKKGRSMRDAERLASGVNKILTLELAPGLEARANEERIKEESRLREEQAESYASNIRSKGPVRAYLERATFRYKKCEYIANVFLDTKFVKYKDTPYFQDKYESNLKSIEDCANNEESALADEIRLILPLVPPNVLEQVKDLHSYIVASIRSLKNFSQSAIEARRSRAERSAGIDERSARIDLEL